MVARASVTTVTNHCTLSTVLCCYFYYACFGWTISCAIHSAGRPLFALCRSPFHHHLRFHFPPTPCYSLWHIFSTQITSRRRPSRSQAGVVQTHILLRFSFRNNHSLIVPTFFFFRSLFSICASLSFLLAILIDTNKGLDRTSGIPAQPSSILNYGRPLSTIVVD